MKKFFKTDICLYINKALILFLMMFLFSCSDNSSYKSSTDSKYFSIKEISYQKKLYFNGVIQPISQTVIVSPFDATIKDRFFDFGEQATKDELMLRLSSPEVEKKYNISLSDYLKAKDNYNNSQAKFRGSDDLYKEGLISRNSYLLEKSSLNSAYISLLQSKQNLTEVLESIGEDNPQEFLDLTFSDLDKTKSFLTKKYNIFNLYAKSSGVVLDPPKNNLEKSSDLNIGQQLKKGEPIVLIGDMSGISLVIDIPEIDIKNIVIGQKAMISGVAFDREKLYGKVKSINYQAHNTLGAALASFSAEITVDKLTPQQQNLIKDGMSGKVEIKVLEKTSIMVPKEFIYRDNGEAMLTVVKNKQHLAHKVVVGDVSEYMVEIIQGLKSGDLIVNDNA